MEKKKTKKKVETKKGFNFTFMVLCFIVLIILVLIALIQWSVLSNPFTQQKKEFEIIPLADACSIIVGQLIHTIPNEDICNSKCHASCEVRKKSYITSNFTEKKGDCNLCNCFCE